MEKYRHQLGRRATMMVAGILLIGISVGLLRLAAFGVDPFSCMNMGISGFLGMSFGNWQLIANILLLIVVFFTARSFIGLGTVVNMVFVGYIADFVCWLAQDAGMESPLALRIALLLVGIVMTCAGAGIYMAADLGIAPFEGNQKPHRLPLGAHHHRLCLRGHRHPLLPIGKQRALRYCWRRHHHHRLFDRPADPVLPRPRCRALTWARAERRRLPGCD